MDTMTAAPSPQPENLNRKQLKALAKASRPFYKKKRFVVPAALVALIVIIKASSGGSSTSSKPQAGTVSGSNSAHLFPGRPDAQAKDHEANIGQGADLVGYTATVNSAAFAQSVSQFENKGYVVVDVTILNRNSGSQPYNEFDWKLQTPSGQVIDPGITSGQSLNSGDLVHSGSVNGKLAFEVGAQKGDFYVIYKPKAFDASRGIWKVSI